MKWVFKKEIYGQFIPPFQSLVTYLQIIPLL